MMNRATIVGRLTKDVELRYTQDGTAVASFTVACNRTFGQKETDFIPCVTFKKQAENTSNYTKKGSLVGVDGRIQVRNYEKDGKRIYVTEIIAESVQFLDSRSDSERQPNQSSAPSGSPYKGGIDVSDDDLPF